MVLLLLQVMLYMCEVMQLWHEVEIDLTIFVAQVGQLDIVMEELRHSGMGRPAFISRQVDPVASKAYVKESVHSFQVSARACGLTRHQFATHMFTA